MSKEKLTVKSITDDIQSVSSYEDRIDLGSSRLINLLEQIKDEIISSTYSYNFISQRNIEDVFNKYLNEKGGK